MSEFPSPRAHYCEPGPATRAASSPWSESALARGHGQSTITTSIDELNHVTETETLGNMQKTRSYTGTYPNQVLYTTVTVTNTRGKTVIEDDKDNNPATAGNKIITVFDMLGRKTSYTDPDMGVWSYTYSNERLDTQTDGVTSQIVVALFVKLMVTVNFPLC